MIPSTRRSIRVFTTSEPSSSSPARVPTKTACPTRRAALSAPTTNWERAKSVRSPATMPMVELARWTKLRAMVLGE